MDKYTSPTGGKQGCLCEDETYSIECCKGELINQGIGALEGQGDVVLTQTINERNIVRQNG